MSRERSPYAKCKTCGADIVWLQTKSGKAIPVLPIDQEEQPVNPGDVFDPDYHVAHFSNCAQADQHRRPREQKAPGLWAITLHQPWAWCVAHRGKRIENRDWAPFIEPGTWLAIHAGMRLDKEAVPALREHMGIEVPADLPLGAVVAVGRYAGLAAEDCDDPWYRGPVGWRLEVVRAIEPVPAKGRQKLWRLEGEPYQQVRAAWKKAQTTPPPETAMGPAGRTTFSTGGST